MKQSVKRLALFMAVCVSIVMLAGCATTTPTETEGTTTGTTVGTTTDSMAADSNINPPGQLPVVKETENIRVVLSQSPHILSYKYGENKLTTWLQDRTNVEVEHILFPQADATTKLNLELSTNGDLGDLILIEMDQTMLATYGGQGLLTPLNDYIDKYGSKMKELLDSDPAAYAVITATDGNIYAFPEGGLSSIYPNAYAMRFWMNSGFLAQYETDTGNSMPTTTDEYYDYLVWATTEDPNGNGENDEVGWTGSESRNVWYARPTDFLMNAFVLQDKNGYYQQNDEIHCAMVEDDYRDGLRFLNKLMSEGLLDENYVTNDENQIKTLVTQEDGNTVASISCGGLHIAATDHRIRNMYTIVPPLEGPDGFVNAFNDFYTGGVTVGAASIPSASEKTDVVVAWMDSNYDGEVALRCRYGEKDVDWEVPPEGSKAVDGGPATHNDITSQWNVPTMSHWFTSGVGMWHKYGGSTVLPKPATDAETGAEIHDLENVLYLAARLYEDDVTPCSVPPVSIPTFG